MAKALFDSASEFLDEYGRRAAADTIRETFNNKSRILHSPDSLEQPVRDDEGAEEIDSNNVTSY